MGNIKLETAVFAGGCFWCTEAVFNRVKGVENVVSGFIGGTIKNPAYREIITGRTGHAEAIKLNYNPSVISYVELLEIFFATHNPTTLNKQGHDNGTQYRSAIFYTSVEQKNEIETVIAELTRHKVFEKDIVTDVNALTDFYSAEAEHQAYYDNNKEQSYCQFVIHPKIKKLNAYFCDKLK
jgi:peptide-methionine (S)-S-oxide reductase